MMTTVELAISTMAHGGSGIGRLDGRVVFCPGVIPGEIIEAEIVDDSKKSLWWARAVSVVSQSPHRVPHVWPEADISRPWTLRAGGADYGHIELGHQRSLKTDILRDALERFGGLPPEKLGNLTVKGVPGDDEGNGTGWRTRVSLHANDSGVLGPFAEKTHTVIPVTTIPLATRNIQRCGVLDAAYQGAKSIRVVDAPSGVRLIIDDQKPQEIVEVVQGHEFALSDHSFWQIHHQAPEILRGAVSRAVIRDLLVPDAPNADLYSGVGLLGHALATLSSETLTLTAVESEASALNYLERNLSEVTHLTAVADRVDRWLSHQVRTLGAEEKEKWRKATILLDPPRSGAKAEVIDSLTKLSPAQIVYVACDPVALGRDAGLLQKAGYDMVFIEAWDLFPHTHHLETIATFIKT